MDIMFGLMNPASDGNRPPGFYVALSFGNPVGDEFRQLRCAIGFSFAI